jgi:hypothetical protein
MLLLLGVCVTRTPSRGHVSSLVKGIVPHRDTDGRGCKSINGRSGVENKVQCDETDVLDGAFMNAGAVIEARLEPIHMAGYVGATGEAAFVYAFAVEF